MRRRRTIRSFRLTHILAFIVGSLFGFLLALLPFEFKKEVDPIALISTVLTCTIALYIAGILNNRLTSQQSVKNLAVEQISSVRKFATELKSICAANNLLYTNAAAYSKELFTRYQDLYILLNLCSFNSHNDICEQMRITIRDTRDILTSIPKKTNTAPSSAGNTYVEEDVIRYSSSAIIEIESEIEKINSLLVRLQLAVINE